MRALDGNSSSQDSAVAGARVRIVVVNRPVKSVFVGIRLVYRRRAMQQNLGQSAKLPICCAVGTFVLLAGACSAPDRTDKHGATNASDVDGGVPADAAPPSIFDPSWCTGPAITQQQVESLFAPAATSATLTTTVTVDAQQRVCQDQTGCQPWEATTTVPLYEFTPSILPVNIFNLTNEVDFAVPATGQVGCTVPGPLCSFTASDLSSSVYSPVAQTGVLMWGLWPSLSSDNSDVQVGNWGGPVISHYQTWGTTITTNTCLWGTDDGRVYGDNGTYTEYQLVVYAQY
jgi:hypothetical protein